MNTAMFDAREAMGPGGPYDRSRGRMPAERPVVRAQDNRHDPLTYIGPDRQAVLPPTNLPIPVGIFMNMAHIPPRFYNQHQQLLAAAQGSKQAPPPANSTGRRLGGGKGRKADSQLSQGNSQDISQGYSQ